MNTSNDQFKAFADALFYVYEDYKEKADDNDLPIEHQLMWAIAANLAVKIAATAQAVSIEHKGVKQ